MLDAGGKVCAPPASVPSKGLTGVCSRCKNSEIGAADKKMRRIVHALDTEGAQCVIIATLRAWIGSKLNLNGKCRVKGIHQFQNGIFSFKKRVFEGPVDGQQPLALFITCSDSCIDYILLTQTEPGELFILQNTGNIVPPYEGVENGTDSTVEYAVSVLGVKDIVICGHSHCGVMGALLDQSKVTKLPAVQSWLSHAEPTRRIIEENYAHITDAATRLTATVEENVLVQLEHLQTYPSVAAALGRKALNLHGWVYEFETGQVFGYQSQDGQFVPIDGTCFTTPSATRELPPI